MALCLCTQPYVVTFAVESPSLVGNMLKSLSFSVCVCLSGVGDRGGGVLEEWGCN